MKKGLSIWEMDRFRGYFEVNMRPGMECAQVKIQTVQRNVHLILWNETYTQMQVGKCRDVPVF